MCVVQMVFCSSTDIQAKSPIVIISFLIVMDGGYGIFLVCKLQHSNNNDDRRQANDFHTCVKCT